MLGSVAVGLGTPLDPRSPQTRAIADLFNDTLIVCGVIFAIVTIAVTMAVMRFRDKGKDDKRKPAQIEGHSRLEIAWTIAPLLVLVGIFYLTVKAMEGSDPDPPAGREPDLTVIAHQWWWEVRYKSGAITANEIHIPVGKPLVVRIESADVVHDFWVPDLARKIDAVPGRTSSIWMQADKPGQYLGACAEYCGSQHAWMRILVFAETPEAWAEWEQNTLDPPLPPETEGAARGARRFREMTCVRCHSITGNGEGARAAPDLTHLASRKTLGAGVMKNTPDELARWLRDPQGVKQGSHMPDVQLSDQDVKDFVEYFETLK
jgi:cytochrome c oxidase subunit 2